MKHIKIESSIPGISLDVIYLVPVTTPKALVIVLHGMSEHKERYNYFLEQLAANAYLPVIYDHRGHGKSVKSPEDLGYFYSDDATSLSEDAKIIITYFKERYPHLKVILFAHSMGTLVARNYLSKYDKELTKLILCGPPTKNNLVDVGLSLAKLANTFGNPKKANKFLDKLTFGNFNKKYQEPNEWLSKNPENVKIYNNDSLCGFTFTTNGFLNLYTLQKYAFETKRYQVNNKSLQILLIAGSDDPVIRSLQKFQELQTFLQDLGYNNTKSLIYKDLRHELLQENSRDLIIQDILEFIRKKEIYEKENIIRHR